MPTLNLKPTHKPVKAYCAALEWGLVKQRVKMDKRGRIVNDPAG